MSAVKAERSAKPLPSKIFRYFSFLLLILYDSLTCLSPHDHAVSSGMGMRQHTCRSPYPTKLGHRFLPIILVSLNH